MAADRMASPALALKARPLGCTVIWNAAGVAASALVMWGYPWNRLRSNYRPSKSQANGPNFAFNTKPPWRPPARFRRERLLIVGCGDVGQRILRDLQSGPGAARMRVMALTSSPSRVAGLRALGARPIVGNLDDAPSLRRLAGLATRVLHLAPPPGEGAGGNAWWLDPRTIALARALRLRSLPVSLVYASTSGVYGDCQGALVPETRAVAPGTP